VFVCVFVPWVHHRAWAVLGFVVESGCLLFPAFGMYELQQLHKRKAMQKQQRQITPLRISSSDPTASTRTIADTVAATKQALQSQKQVRRKASASLVLNSGVSLAFLELFIREHSIDASMTANDVVNKHVKPHTEVIGFEGSGAFVELIGDGQDSTGRHWCGTPTHMLSYSWSYSVEMIVTALRNFEQANPPSKAGKGECNYYFVDQVSANVCNIPFDSQFSQLQHTARQTASTIQVRHQPTRVRQGVHPKADRGYDVSHFERKHCCAW
jgi:hypothetical protein